MKKGFTLIEVMVVAVIVAILAAVAIPAYQGYITKAATRVSANMAATVASAAAALIADEGDVTQASIESLKAYTTASANDEISTVVVTMSGTQAGAITVTPTRDGAASTTISF